MRLWTEHTSEQKLAKSNMPYELVPEGRFEDDLEYWVRSSGTMEKIRDLLNSIRENPRAGIGKPERLKYFYPEEVWSRRISREHRLLYRIEKNKVYLLRARYHYE